VFFCLQVYWFNQLADEQHTGHCCYWLSFHA